MRIETYQDQMARLFPAEGNMPHTVTWQVTDACNLCCTYCISGDTEILMADYTKKAIKDIHESDVVLGFDEYTEKNKQSQVKPAKVLHTFNRRAKVLKLTLDNDYSLNITDNHKVLVREDNENTYIEVGNLKVQDNIVCINAAYNSLIEVSISSIEYLPDEIEVYNIETETGTYIANGFAVHNCYQINKKDHVMSWEVAKAFCDMLLNATPENNSYINPEISSGLIMEFIGGEPFLAIDLIDKICDYMIDEMIKRQHPWATRFMISICSNGVLYFDPRVQTFMEKHKTHLSFSITVDGCKELHDACRIFPDGSGSYDLAMSGVNHFRDHFHGHMGSKMTLAPGNIHYTFTAIKNLIENDYDEINLNCVYEEGWTAEHAKTLYSELCKTADYILENDLFDKVKLSIFDPNMFQPQEETDLKNWCFGKDTPVLTLDGYRAIQDLKVGDLVYTSDGTIHPVVETHKHWADNVVKAKAHGEFEITCTDNHNFYVLPFDYEKGAYTDYCKKELKDIREKDLIHLFTLPEVHEGQIKDWIDNNSEHFQINDDTFITSNYYLAQELLVKLRTIGYTSLCNINDNNEYEIQRYKDPESFDYEEKAWTYGIKYEPTDPQEVYNITVDENHSYIAGGFVVSNCGGLGDMLSCDWKGDLYPCIRYMESSLGDDCEPIKVGNVFRGILTTPEEQQTMKCMECVNRRTQSTDECFYCPIATGCSWCFAAGTKITTPNGFKNIEDLVVGDVVVSDDGSQQPVERVMSRNATNTIRITADSVEPLYTTTEHPIMTRRFDSEDYDWLSAGQIVTGDLIAKMEAPFDVVEWIEVQKVETVPGYEVYNLTVANTHTYIANNIIVHNCSAYNYQDTGSYDKRATHICIMHKARALANAYFYNMAYLMTNDYKAMHLFVPDEWALEIIDEEELLKLKTLESMAMDASRFGHEYIISKES